MNDVVAPDVAYGALALAVTLLYAAWHEHAAKNQRDARLLAAVGATSLLASAALLGVGGLLVIAGVAQALSCFEGCSDGAEAAGGVNMLKALAGPYGHTGVKFIPTGGVSSGNLAAYLKLPVVAAFGGSWLVDKQLVNEGKWAEITRITREALAAAAEAR